MKRVFRVASLVLVLLAAPSVLAQPSLTPPEEVRSHLQQQASELGLSAEDFADLVVTDSYLSRRSGVTYVYVRQALNGIPVVGSEFTTALDRNGEVVHAVGRGVPLAAQRGVPASRSVSAQAAVEALARDVGLSPSGAFSVLSRAGTQAPTVTLSEGGVAQRPVKANLVYHADAAGSLALAWEVELEERARPHYWLGYVDAATGAVRERSDLVVYDDFGTAHGGEHATTHAATHAGPVAAAMPLEGQAGAVSSSVRPSLSGSYTVYAFPLESPLWAATAPPGDARTSEVNSADATASPFGWHDTNGSAGAEFTTTQGNNVHAYTDVDGDNVPDQGSSPDGGPNLVFDFPVDLTQDPSTYRPAAVTNLFYWSNIIHDVMYQYGFDEPAGNFQVNNYGNGGVGNDAVLAEAQDDSNGLGNCNANFATPSDGGQPRMQMYTCDLPTPDVDGDFDNGVIIHEYGHGISNRLTGGPALAGCLNTATTPEQMGEGWSDYYAIMFTMDAADTRTTSRPIGNYLIGQSQAGGGIRPAPYNTSFAVNSFTYGDTNGGGLAVPHGIGFVWSTILWEMTWDLIDAFGFDPDIYAAGGTAGNQIALNLVTEGMKMQPCSPGFVDGRDGILAADAFLYPDPAIPGQGLHHDIIWDAFARRGLGFSADQGSSGSNGDNVEAFDTPGPAAELDYAPSSISVTLPSGEVTSATVTLSNIALSGAADLEWQAFVEGAGVSFAATAEQRGVRSARVPQAPMPPAWRKGEVPSASTGGLNLTGGPDAFGYTFIDVEAPSPLVDFQDISGTGTPITFTAVPGYPAGDEGYADIALPFAFPFYGADQASVRVFANGFLSFSSFASESFNYGPIPNAAAPNALIAPFWHDLDQNAGGTVYTGTLPDGRFVVQYDTVPTWGTTNPNTFQVILSEDGGIEIQYADMLGIVNQATVGIENAAGTDGIQVASNVAYATSNKALFFVAPGWASVSPSAGTIVAGGDDSFDVSFDASGLSEGIYTADLILLTNDSNNLSVVIPLQLEVASFVEVDVYAMLSGAYDSVNGVMRTDLAAGAYIPTTQPFGGAGYAGSETIDAGVLTGPDPPVDWVLLHLRSTPGGAPVASRAALLLSDGLIVDMDGISPVAFDGVDAGSYYVVVEARNHLAVMTASPVDASSGLGLFDFTTSLAQAYPGSGAAMTEVDAGVWALWAGDANGDGQVTAPDFNAWSAATAAGATGYEVSDFNLDGQVTAPDFNAWSAATAAGATTAVPLTGNVPAVRSAVRPMIRPSERAPTGVIER